MTRFWAFVQGAVRLRITGEMPERLLNLCLDAGIPVWDVRYEEDGITCTIPLSRVLGIRPLVRKARCRVRIIGRSGLPFAWRRIRRRRMLLAAAVIVFIGLQTFGSFVWFFEVRGAEQLSEAEILRAAAAAGLAPGAWRPALDRDAVARRMILKMPSISWVGIEFVGTKAIITVVESKLPPDESPLGPGDLVARRPGVIEEILVLQGEPAVREGDTVVPGQLLVRGRISAPGPSEQFPAPGEERPAEHFRPVRAKGRVLARTWYRGYLEVPLTERTPARTGRTAQQRLLLLAGRSIVIGGVRSVPFARYESDRVERPLPPWAGEGAAFRLATVTYHEVDDVVTERSPEEALQEAQRRLRAALMSEVDVDARILAARVEERKVQGAFAYVRMTLEVIEDIGEFIPNNEPPEGPDSTE